MKKLLFIACLCFSFVGAKGQFSVTGKVTDSVGTTLPYTTVVLSTLKDTTMVNYAITDPAGFFQIDNVAKGKYILQASFMGYANYKKVVSVGANSETNLGRIILSEEKNELNEVVIEGEAMPILFKKDTVEYNAGSFKTKKNDNVEGLLKKLPGVEVDENGDVTAHGETVTKILVDGKEFFGDDPKVATRNIPADAIKKVQVFDKKSEMAEFTGVDDGTRTRTINLTLKEDRKKGYFGNASLAGGYQDRYEGKLNLNRFSQTAQFTSLLMANNTNQQGFSYRDYFNFMGGISNVLKTGKMNFDPSETGVPINVPGANNGVANTLAGGINYNQDIGKHTHIISSFFANNSNTDIIRSTNTTNFVNDETFVSNSLDDQNQLLQSYRLNAKVQHEFSEMNRLDLKFTGIYSGNNDRGISTDNNQFANGKNNSAQNIFTDKAIGMNGQIDANFRQKFKKEGRSMNIDGSFYALNNDGDRNIQIQRDIIVDTLPIRTNQVQLQTDLNDKKEYVGKVTWTEPLNRKMYLIADVGTFYQTQSRDKNFFDSVGSQSVKNEFLSNDFRSEYSFNQLGTKINYKYKKNLFVLGVDGQISQLKGTANTSQEPILRNFGVFLPNFYWKNQASMSNRFELRYTTAFTEPSIDQLQPVVNNTNPLNIYEGNPNLIPEYSHSISYGYFKYDAFNYTNLSANIALYDTENKIVNAQYIDSTTNLRRSTPINTKNNIGGNASFGYGFRIKPLKTKIQLRVNGGLGNGINFVNDVENDFSTYDYGFNVRLSNIKKEVFDISAGTSMSVNENKFSLNPEANTRYINTSIFAEVNVELKKNWSFGADAKQSFYKGSLNNDNPSFLIVNAYVAKTITKNQRGDLELSVSDLLNQRTGVNFYGQQNYFVESNVNVLKRYFLLTFKYKIIKI